MQLWLLTTKWQRRSLKKSYKALPQQSDHQISRACRVLNMSKSVYDYKPVPKDDTAIEQALQQKTKEHSEEGF